MVDPIVAVAVGVVLLVAVPVFWYFFPPRSVLRALRAFERASGTPPTYAGVAIVVAAAVLVAVVVATDDLSLAGGTVAALGVFGPLFAALGLGNVRAARRVRAATERPTGAAGQGLVAVTGAVEAVDDPFDTPAGDAVYCAYDLQRGRRTHRSTVWQTVAEGERVVPLVVDDGSGAVRVDTAGATVRAASYEDAGTARRVVDLDAGDPVPEDVAAFLAREGVASPDRVDGDYRFRYRVLAPGDVVTAVGDHERVTREGEAFWGLTGATGPAYLFPGEYEAVRTTLRTATRTAAPLGLLATLLGVAGAAWLVV